LNSDDFAKLSTTCNVLKEERKKEEKIGTKKGKKKGKTTISLKVSNDTWQDQMDDEDYAGYDDDFMYFCLCKQFD
jgi:singapore isolate B (sub-type 7) whole genome shotgun sequence assembly, scaffold_9